MIENTDKRVFLQRCRPLETDNLLFEDDIEQLTPDVVLNRATRYLLHTVVEIVAKHHVPNVDNGA